jgi:integrase/recombinase XerD
MHAVWESYLKYFGNYLKLERSLSENSVLAYLRDAEKFSQYVEHHVADKRVTELTPQHIHEFLQYLAQLGLSPHSQARILSGLKAFFSFLITEEVLTESPAALIEAPKVNRKLPDTLSFPEIEKILESVDVSTMEGLRNRTLLEVLYSSGLRVTELVELQISNIFFDVGFLRIIGKGNKERLVPAGRDALRFLKAYIEDARGKKATKNGQIHLIQVPAKYENYVFLNNRGTPLSRIWVFLVIKEAVARAGIHNTVSPHTFSHSFATHLIEGGADLRAVQEMLGHESITTTEIYTHLDRDYLRQTLIDFHPRSKT